MIKHYLKIEITRKHVKTAVIVLLLLNAAPVFSEEQAKNLSLPNEVTIQELLQIVREKSPRYALTRNQIEQAQAEVVAADVLPNPKVSYGRYDQAGGRRNTQFDGPSQQNITVEVPLLLAGQRGARKEAAERRVEVAEADVKTQYNQLIRNTWQLFAQLLAGQQRVAVLEDANRELERLQSIITGKENAGTASRYDVMRINQEVQSLKARLENVHTDNASTVGEMSVLLGFPNWKPQVKGVLAPIGVAADVKALWLQAEQNNPELESARRETIAADSGLERARRERWPVPSLLAGTAFTDQPYGNTTFVGVSVDLPIFDRGQGGMARASAEKHASELKQELLLASTKQELQRAVDVLISRRKTLAKFEHSVLEPLPTLKQMAEDAYRLGQTGLLELLDSSRSSTEIKLNHLELLIGEIEAELDTLMASGLLANSLEELK
ncbi:MAG: TolC family protein [Methylococcaceae bacterium]|nr:TolC family protein [Methylococcaceae bacterium]MDP3019941.1 TolC family protein [Methylococcaceae bacterium]MDP3389936.1 TolC family protein [Methylococcaceae bacterium]MDP3934163.1 TolC family protein [Methylococcaceae bacterium]MDZ4155965.1 TolC family protein [Methylococcales bacterium]